MQIYLLYIEIIYNISVICKDLIFLMKKTSSTKKLHFWKIDTLLILFDENNIAKLFAYMWVNSFNRMFPLLFNWIWMDMIFKSNLSKMFLKFFAKFTWKHLRLVTMLKRDSSSGVLHANSENFVQNTFGWLLLGFFEWTNRNQVFSNFEHVWLPLLNVMNTMIFAIGKLCFAELRNIFFLMILHVKGL